MSTDRVILWSLRAIWATLPLTAGPATAAALDEWSSTPATVAAVLLWAGWTAGLLGAVVPRAETITALRAIAPAFVVLAIVLAFDADVSTGSALVALAAVVVAAILAASTAVAVAAVNAASYGDEERFPLRVPPALFLGPLPLARVAVASGVAAGPLLLADGQIVLGIAALVVGGGAAALGVRALHGLSGRFVVLVPAGIVVVDPLTLSDPVLFVREHVLALRALRPHDQPGDALDLRLGATAGMLSILLDEEAELMRSTPGRRAASLVRARELWVTVARREALLRQAATRRMRVTR